MVTIYINILIYKLVYNFSNSKISNYNKYDIYIYIYIYIFLI